MRQRSDPLTPILGSAVALVVVGAIGLFFYPRISRWFGPARPSVASVSSSPATKVPVWICRSVEGVALLLETQLDEASARVIDRALTGGRYHYLRLSVYNFGRDGSYALALDEGLASPEGGPRARTVASLLRKDLPAHERPVLLGLGAVASIEVAKGHHGQILLALAADPATRGSFAGADLMFERRVLERQTLAQWQDNPDLKQFLDF